MGVLLLLTASLTGSSDVLPALGLLGHTVHVRPAEAVALLDAPDADIVLVDARRDLLAARSFCRLLRTTGLSSPLIGVVAESGWAAVSSEWGLDDLILHGAGPAEVEARLRLAIGRAHVRHAEPEGDGLIRGGDLVIDEQTYSCKLRHRSLELTFKEFELLKFLTQHPGRVFSRAQLLQEVWGYDYYGGTRTVDVHVRRLRAKLGPDNESLIGTVRHVGYKFVTPPLTPLPGSVEVSDDRPADARV
ncbi:MAG TPA: response regulator transcription factor [Mycobacteriales bacterium]